MNKFALGFSFGIKLYLGKHISILQV